MFICLTYKSKVYVWKFIVFITMVWSQQILFVSYALHWMFPKTFWLKLKTIAHTINQWIDNWSVFLLFFNETVHLLFTFFPQTNFAIVNFSQNGLKPHGTTSYKYVLTTSSIGKSIMDFPRNYLLCQKAK